MEIQYAKENERKLLTMELLLILAIGIAGLIVYALYRERLYAAFSPKFFEILYRQGHIAVLISAFMLFNTSYFSYASYRSMRMMVLSGTSVFLASTQGYFFLSSYMRIAETSGFSENAVTLQTTGIAFIFILGLAVSHFLDEEVVIVGNRWWHAALPIFVGLVVGVIGIASISALTEAIPDSSVAQWCFFITSMGLLIGTLTFSYEIYRFYISSNRYLIRLSTSIALISFSMGIKLLGGRDFVLSSFVFNLYFVLGLLSYLYAAFKYNISMPIIQQKNAERQITLYAENLEKIVQKRTAELKRGNEMFLTDIEYAKKIQQSLLPGDYLKFSGAAFATAYYPCERLSGDFYDIFMIDSETLGMYVLDVSGHGIPAALMTMFCMNYIKTSERLINQYRAKKPHRNLKHFFDEFNKVNFPDEMHMVMFFAAYDMRQRILTYCSGGLNTLPFVMKTTGEIIKLDQSIGFPICRVGNFFSPDYHSAKIELEEGDRVFFFTDGLTDKGKNQVFDDLELLEMLVAQRHEDLMTLRKNMVTRLSEVVNRLDDDITFFVMEVT